MWNIFHNMNHMPECETYVECESYVNVNHMSEWELYVRIWIICQNVNNMQECESYVNVNHMSMLIIC